MFFLVPLFVIALLVWVDRGARRPRILTAVAAVAAGALPAAIPYERFIETGAVSDTLMLLPLWSLQDTITLPRVDEAVLVAGLAAAAAFLLVPRRFALAFPLGVLAYFALAFTPVTIGSHGIRLASVGAGFTGIGAEHRDWVDRTVPKGATVAVLWSGLSDRFTVNQNEFFNRSLGGIYTLRGPLPGNLPGETPVAIGDDGIIRRLDGSPVLEDYVLADGTIALDGEPVARDMRLGLTVYRTDGPLLSLSRVVGVYDDQWSGAEVTYRRLRCEGGTLTVTLEGDPALFDRPQTVEAESRGARTTYRRVVVVPPMQTVEFTVLLDPRDGACTARFTTETKVPGGDDDRELGIHFRAFDYRAP